MKQTTFAHFQTSALFSDDRLYRFRLSRTWDHARPALVAVLLNPSNADEHLDDPTIARCISRAWSGGYGGLVVVNLFAFRSTNPKALVKCAHPVGDANDAAIIDTCLTAQGHGGRIVCGWGNHGALHGRGRAVEKMLRDAGIKLYALAWNKDGSPKHPLYVATKCELVEWVRA